MSRSEGEKFDERGGLPPMPRRVRYLVSIEAHTELAQQLDSKLSQ
jgi:hypothetical protein